MTTLVGTVFPVAEEWLGIGREPASAVGVAVSPTATVAVEKVDPDEKYNMLDDNSIRGMMANLFSVTGGTQYADVNFSGPVYLDTIGHVLLNLMGDYAVTGTAGTGSTTTTAIAAAGATTLSVTAITGFSNGQAVQIGTGASAQIVVLSIAPVGTTLTFTGTPLRSGVASGATVAGVIAPFTHVFSLLNTNPGQPPTHTLTFHQGISGSFGAVQYPYWCCSGCSFNMDAEKLFTHDTKGMSYIRQNATSALTNSFSNVPVYPNWRFSVGIGGPATGGTQVPDIAAASLDITRDVKTYFTAAGQQAPYVIARNALHVEGKFTHVAQNDNPMLNLLNNTQPQVQLLATNGLSGASLLAVTFDIQVAAYETTKMQNNEVIEYEVNFRGVANPTNAGVSGGQSPMKVTIQNAVPTY
jgi:hypothetical protein